MKSIWMVAIFILSWSGFASADESNWSAGLSGRYRFERQSQFDLANTKELESLRLRPNLSFTGIDHIKIYMEPQFNKILGQQSYVPVSATANAATETSGNTAYTGAGDSVNLRNAYFDLTVIDGLNLIVGRQALAYGDEYILGVSDWGVYGRTFDAARLKYTAPKTSIDLFRAKIVETVSTGANLGGDKDLYGLYATYAPIEQIKAFDVYGFYLNDDESQAGGTPDASRPWHFGVYGARLVTQFGAWSWKAEYAKDYGSENTPVLQQNSNDDMVDTQVARQFGDHTFTLQFFRAGENWRELYPSPHLGMGRSDVLGRRNITGGAVKWSAQWDEHWLTYLDFLYFTRTKASATAFQPDSKTALGATASSSRDVGTELDLNTKYLMNKNLMLTLGVNFFRTGKYLEDSLGGRKPEPFYGYFMIETKY